MSGLEAAGISLALVREIATLLARLRNFNRRMRNRPAHLEALASHFSHVEQEFDAIRGEIEGFDPGVIDLEAPGARILLNLIQQIDDCLGRLSSRLEYLQGMSAPGYLGNVKIQNETDEVMADMQTIRNEIDFQMPSLRFWILQIQTKTRSNTSNGTTRSPQIQHESSMIPQRQLSEASTLVNGRSNWSLRRPSRTSTIGNNDRPSRNQRQLPEVPQVDGHRSIQPNGQASIPSTINRGDWIDQHRRKPSEASTIGSAWTDSRSRRPSEASSVGTDKSTLYSPRQADRFNHDRDPRILHKRYPSDASAFDSTRSSQDTGRVSHDSSMGSTTSTDSARSEIEIAVREFDVEKVRRLLRNDTYGDLRRTKDARDHTLMDILICQTPRTHENYIPMMKLLANKKVKFTLRRDATLLRVYNEHKAALNI